MAEKFIQLTKDGKRIRTRERRVNSSLIQEIYVLPQHERVVSTRATASTFRTLGSAASPHNLMTIENGSAASGLIAVRYLTLEVEYTAVLTAIASQVRVSKTPSLPTGGTLLSKSIIGCAPSNATTVCRGATASDGATATAITATSGTTLCQRFVGRMHTAVGQIIPHSINLLPPFSFDQEAVILKAGEALLVQLINPTGANNPNTNHYIVNGMWEEFIFP